jgi:DNA-binding transcriptional LysR family regulator
MTKKITGVIKFAMNQFLLQKAEKIKFSDFAMLDDLARLGSIREVSRILKSTPAQISRRLKIVEKAVGYRIFERSSKGLSLTGQGHEMMKSVLAVNGEFHLVVKQKKQNQLDQDKPIGLAATSFLTSYAILPTLGELTEIFPNKRSYVQSFNPDDLISHGIKGAFHIAVHPNYFDWPRSWQSQHIGFLRWGLFSRKGQSIAKLTKNIEEVPFVYPMAWDGTKLVVQNDNCPLPVMLRNSFIGTQTAEQAMHLIQCSNVVGFLPELMMRNSVAEGKVVEVKMPTWPSIQQPIYLSVRTDSVPESYYKEIEKRLKLILK